MDEIHQHQARGALDAFRPTSRKAYLRATMTRLIIDITDPKREKKVAEALLKLGGVEVVRAEAIPDKASKGKAKRVLSAKEKRFVAELRQALKELGDHVSGKRKFQSAREFLNGL